MAESYVTRIEAIWPSGRREELAVDVSPTPRGRSWQLAQRRAWLLALARSGYREARVEVTETRGYERRVWPAASRLIVPRAPRDPLDLAIARVPARSRT